MDNSKTNGLKLGVVMPVFNRPKLVLEALNSIIRQTVLPQAVVVVDDGSTDDTLAELDRWLGNHTDVEFNIQIETLCHQGQAAARNAGVRKLGEVDLIAFLDSDDLWPEDYVERMVSVMRNEPDAVAVSCNMLATDLDGTRSKLHRFNAVVEETTWTLYRGLLPGPPVTVIRSSAFHDAGGFEPSLPCAEDYYLFLKLSLRGPWLFADGEPVITRSSNGPRKDQASQDGVLARAVQAHMLEFFATEIADEATFSGRNWRRRVAKMWYRAGCYLMERHKRMEATQAFGHACRIRPWHLRAWISMRRSDLFGGYRQSDLNIFPQLPFMGDRKGEVYRVATFLRQLTNKDDVILSQFAPELLTLFSERTVMEAEPANTAEPSRIDVDKAHYIIAPDEGARGPIGNLSADQSPLAVIADEGVNLPLMIFRLNASVPVLI